MAVVTVPSASAGAPAVSYTFNPGVGLTAAQQIANALAAAVTSQTLSVDTLQGAGLGGTTILPGAFVLLGASAKELYIPPSVSQTVTLPATSDNPGPRFAEIGASINTGTTYQYIINKESLAPTISAGTGTAILTGANGGSFTGTGNSTIVAAGGNNVISQTGTGQILLVGGSGNNTISGTGAGSIIGGSGTNLITANGSGEYIQANGADTIRVTAGSGEDTVDFTHDTTPGSSLTVTGGAHVQVWGAPIGSTVNTQAGVVTAFAGNGAVYDATQSTSFLLVDGGNAATVTAGNNQSVLFGAPGGSITLNNASSTGSAIYSAASGNTTLNASGSAAPVAAWSGSGNSMMTGGSGNDTLVAGSGSSTMAGGSGNNVFAFLAARGPGGAVTITDMNTSDTVEIFGYGASKSAILSAINGATGSSFTLTDGTSITFLNTTVSAMKNSIQVQGVT